ncbi:hypothetical protein D9M72_618330 [compost metagenome]
MKTPAPIEMARFVVFLTVRNTWTVPLRAVTARSKRTSKSSSGWRIPACATGPVATGVGDSGWAGGADGDCSVAPRRFPLQVEGLVEPACCAVPLKLFRAASKVRTTSATCAA